MLLNKKVMNRLKQQMMKQVERKKDNSNSLNCFTSFSLFAMQA
jgi:hypothetical protein